MNYRHAFHAGNFADVVKHLIVCRIVEYLKRKPAPFRVVDTHAGIGLYDLGAEEAERTGEWREGIGRLWTGRLSGEAADLAEPYLDTVRAENPEGELRHYPGSPLLVRRLLRPSDKLVAFELHPDDATALAALFRRDREGSGVAADGWDALAGQLPPPERRGLVLVDPPFEMPGEFRRLAGGLARAHRRFAGGTFALWYPIKDVVEVESFIASLEQSAIPDMLRIELTIRAPSTPPRLHGTGMIVVNPPFALETELRVLLPELALCLADEARGGWRLEWLTAG